METIFISLPHIWIFVKEDGIIIKLELSRSFEFRVSTTSLQCISNKLDFYGCLWRMIMIAVCLFKCVGVFGMVWFVFWWFLSSESPATSKTISNEERLFIETSLLANTCGVSNKVRRFRYLFIYLSICLSVCLYLIYLSIYLSIDVDHAVFSN